MSGFEKTQEPYVYDYSATRPNPEQRYPSYAQPSFAAQYSIAQARQSHGPSSAEQMPFISGSSLEARDVPYQAEYSSYIAARSRHLPEVTNYSPRKGLHGDKLYVYFRTTNDLATPPTQFFSIMFGHKRCDATWSKTETRGTYHQYALALDIPPFDATGYIDGTVPLLLNVDDEFGQSLGVFEVGDFTYDDASSYQSYSSASPQDMSRKRKVSADSAEFLRSPPKHLPGQQILPDRTRAPGVYSTTPSSDSSYLQTPTSSAYSYPGAFDRSQMQSRSYGQQYTQQAPQKSSYQYSPSLSLVHGPVKSYMTTNYGSYPPMSQSLRTPSFPPGNLLARSTAMPSPSALANPPLIRTSTLQPQGGMSSFQHNSSQAFNPYAMYPNSKASLRIEGDLEAMAEDWTREEWKDKRRLVQFRRKQSGSTITTTFKPVAPEDRMPHSICISCIWWEEKQECFVTSVDTIYLLESLVAVRFTVEEKNRIRRNLEGFRPLTVSKAKAESEEFFKVIMGFPNPKPRNIEKDVKVFPWKILSHALKKIIGKYSASYSSTAGVLPTPVASGYGSGPDTTGAVVGGTTDLRHTASPRSATSSASTAYASSMTSTALSPGIKASPALGGGPSAGPPDLRVSVPQLGGGALGTWPTAQQQQQQQQQSQYGATAGAAASLTGATGGGTAGGARGGSWDFAAYMDASPASATTSSTAQGYQQHDHRAADTANAYQQYGGTGGGGGGGGQRTSRA